MSGKRSAPCFLARLPPSRGLQILQAALGRFPSCWQTKFMMYIVTPSLFRQVRRPVTTVRQLLVLLLPHQIYTIILFPCVTCVQREMQTVMF